VLEELKARQIDGESHRRWFGDDDWDLIVWQSASGEVVGFQICYDRTSEEHALTWRQDCGFTHQRVDDGQGSPHYSQTPVLMPDGEVDIQRLTHIFIDKSGALDPDIVQFIRAKLLEYH